MACLQLLFNAGCDEARFVSWQPACGRSGGRGACETAMRAASATKLNSLSLLGAAAVGLSAAGRMGGCASLIGSSNAALSLFLSAHCRSTPFQKLSCDDFDDDRQKLPRERGRVLPCLSRKSGSWLRYCRARSVRSSVYLIFSSVTVHLFFFF